MEPEHDDHVLNVLHAIAAGAGLSVGIASPSFCGPARIDGIIADSDAYTEHLGEE